MPGPERRQAMAIGPVQYLILGFIEQAMSALDDALD
jgi:hypothetical protein